MDRSVRLDLGRRVKRLHRQKWGNTPYPTLAPGTVEASVFHNSLTTHLGPFRVERTVNSWIGVWSPVKARGAIVYLEFDEDLGEADELETAASKLHQESCVAALEYLRTHMVLDDIALA